MDKDEVVQNLRATLLSSKGGVNIEALNRDYHTIVGENIPYKQFGFTTLEGFLSSIPNIKINNKGGQWYVEAHPTEISKHILKLISRQRTASKKKKSPQKTITPFRVPRSTKNINYSVKNYNQNPYVHSTYRVENTVEMNASKKVSRYSEIRPVPLMEITTVNPSKFSNIIPRFMQPISGIPTSPSKKLKNKQINFVEVISNPSINTSKNDVYVKSNNSIEKPVMFTKPKVAEKNMEIPSKGKYTNISERLKLNEVPSSSNEVIPSTQPELWSPQSELLSPLSPAQLITHGNNVPFPVTPVKSLNLADTAISNDLHSLSLIEDPRTKLLDQTIIFNLPKPVYKILPSNIKNTKEVAIYAHVKIGQHGYNSYPQEAYSNSEAEKIVATIALNDLIEKFGSFSGAAETSDKTLIKERLIEIVDCHKNGVFKHQIPIYYKQKYKECLPINWLQIVETCSEIILEKSADNSTILHRFTLHHEESHPIITTRGDEIKLNPIGPIVPGQLQLPENEEFLIAHVSCVISTVDIWVRLVGADYSDKFDIMVAEMMEHYSQEHNSIIVEVGNYYVIFQDEGWHRVRCESYSNVTGLATILFIDHGDEDQCHYSKLQLLDKKFCSLPAQAMRMCLAGLEDFNDCEIIMTHVEKTLLGQTFYVEVLNHGIDNDGLYATVIFYDTHGVDDININEDLSKKIIQNVITPPKLDVGQVAEVILSHIEGNGDIYVQVQTREMKYLTNSINRLMHERLATNDLKDSAVAIIDTIQIYIISMSGKWYRGKVTNTYSNNHVKMLLIDFGRTTIVSRSSLLDLKKLSEILTKFPAQALKVHLHNIRKSVFDGKMVSRLSELAPPGERIVVKVVTYSKIGIPIVELFKRIQPNNVLASINTTLIYDEELTKSSDDGNNDAKPRKRVERTISRGGIHEDEDSIKLLKPPKISGIGDYFDVHVTMAAHPGNFTVQPFEDKQALQNMMTQLQECCLLYEGPCPTLESIREGKLYAAEHIDGHWYRVCVSNIIKEDMVTVYFCDFGDVSLLTLDKLQPLKSQFLDLPYQAIKARLVGIKPINIDWTVEDCLRFQKLVLERNFVSIVLESRPDKLNPADIVIGLKLIDVDTEEDVYIDRLLVEERRAVFV